MRSTLDVLIDRTRAEKELEYCPDKIEECDVCGCDLRTHRFVIDGALKQVEASPWAYMCESCFLAEGAGIGWGYGQLYEKTKDNEWLLVAGFSSEESDVDSDVSAQKDQLDVCDILSELKKKYSNWLKPEIVKVQIEQDTESVWLTIVQSNVFYTEAQDYTTKRLNLEFIVEDDFVLTFTSLCPIYENAKKFVEELSPFDLINTTDLFHERACKEVNALFNSYLSIE